jgi:xylulose-5-phosphate/fructose-6-phosphate phosphoketolase
MDQAIKHCTKGIGIWDWASNDDQGVTADVPDVVMACCGDVPTMESLAATAMLREEFPELKVRFINVVDLYKLMSPKDHSHGLSDRDFDTLFTSTKPVIFNFHGYPWLIHKLTYARSNQTRIHVRGYSSR